MNRANFTSSISAVTNLSTLDNGTEFFGKMYVFKPFKPTTKLVLLLILVVVGIIAFAGNILVLAFLKTKDRATSFLRTYSFEMNFHFYIKSLAISDVLSSVISFPYMSLQLYLDVLQRGWACRIGRFIVLVFPYITINNLLVITFGKYFATREVPRTFSHSTVKRIVLFAWLEAFLFALLPPFTYNGIRYEVNSTHYTVVCMYDEQYLPSRIILVSATILQYIIPSCILIRLNISLIITAWTRASRTMDVQRDNNARSRVTAARFRSVSTVVALTFAFITPYLLYVAYIIFHMVAQPNMDFETDHVIRFGGVILALSNSAINVLIYIVKMKDFRTFLKEKFKF